MFDGCILLDDTGFHGPSLHVAALVVRRTSFLEGIMEDQVTDRISAKQTRREAIACDMCVSRHVAAADVGYFKKVNYRVAKQINVCFHSTIKTLA